MSNNGKEKRNNPNMTQEREISPIFSTIDTDLARDNLENDITDADLQDL